VNVVYAGVPHTGFLSAALTAAPCFFRFEEGAVTRYDGFGQLSAL
jgi:hypothetical protein